jgi:hypothetical protein
MEALARFLWSKGGRRARVVLGLGVGPSGRSRQSPMDAPLGGTPLGNHFWQRPGTQRSPHDHDDFGIGRPLRPHYAKCLADQALRAIARRSVADTPRGRHAESRTFLLPPLEEKDEIRRDDTSACVLDPLILRPPSDPIARRKPTSWPATVHYFLLLAVTARRQRPRRRRFASTARPPRLLRRLRNPCVRRRLRLWGWYVRFINH